jgi:hypothetical protein
MEEKNDRDERSTHTIEIDKIDELEHRETPAPAALFKTGPMTQLCRCVSPRWGAANKTTGKEMTI